MPIAQFDLNGSPYVGVFARANDQLVLVPHSTPANLLADFERALGAKPIVMAVGGSNILGSLVALNSSGAVLADFAEDADIATLREAGLKVGRIGGKYNAAGNNLLCNDHGALANPDLSDEVIGVIAETLGVRVERGTLAGIKTVGSAACATSKGVLCHPKTTDTELDFLEDLLKVEADIGTVNHGAPFLGAGLVANKHGAIVGSACTGPEVNRVENALDLI